ncbi:unnamed protein product [Cylicocyclus nassatus]|uniref:Uncharacterized protein n=1 Tax=Cylicocyclus nassatus TaxID=53992 RepID=A0AA36HE99_CYLNA|nr:unnamed protein product [Cylicocyclus nassatus]
MFKLALLLIVIDYCLAHCGGQQQGSEAVTEAPCQPELATPQLAHPPPVQRPVVLTPLRLPELEPAHHILRSRRRHRPRWYWSYSSSYSESREHRRSRTRPGSRSKESKEKKRRSRYNRCDDIGYFCTDANCYPPMIRYVASKSCDRAVASCGTSSSVLATSDRRILASGSGIEIVLKCNKWGSWTAYDYYGQKEAHSPNIFGANKTRHEAKGVSLEEQFHDVVVSNSYVALAYSMLYLLALAILPVAIGHGYGYDPVENHPLVVVGQPPAPAHYPPPPPSPQIVPVYPYYDDWDSSSSESHERRSRRRRHRNERKRDDRRRRKCKELRDFCHGVANCTLPKISYFYDRGVELAYINCQNVVQPAALMTGNMYLSRGTTAKKLATCWRGMWTAYNVNGTVSMFDNVRCVAIEEV